LYGLSNIGLCGSIHSPLPNGGFILSGNDENMRSESIGNEELLTVSQVAEALSVQPGTVRKWIKTGAISAVKLPRRPGQLRREYRIKRRVVDDLLKLGN
jgi:excisionase family DNA binding protein